MGEEVAGCGDEDALVGLGLEMDPEAWAVVVTGVWDEDIGRTFGVEWAGEVVTEALDERI